jgi:hypothetical protein
VERSGFVVLGLQLVAMLVFSTLEYHRFALTRDFADYSQAWWSIGHGVLDPKSTIVGVPFWRNNAEFMMWPLGLLSHLFPNPVSLLWVQDLVVVATELVAFRWISAVVTARHQGMSVRTRDAVGVAALFALVANPWVYETIAFDFHFEPIAALFAILVARDLWSGRTTRLWWWVPLALLCDAFGPVYLLGVGFSGVLASRRTRLPGALVAGAGAAWLLVLTRIGAVGVGGRALKASYGYLVPGHVGRVSSLDVVAGALTHPSAAVHMVATHLAVSFGLMVSVGLLGLVSPWGIGMAAVVLAPNVLDATGLFIRYDGAFQTWPAMPFVLVGSVMVVLRMVERGARGRRVAAGLAAAWTTMAAVLALGVIPRLPAEWLQVDPAAAAMLSRAQAQVAPGAEVVASQGMAGRFADRASVYVFERGGQSFPVVDRTVVFVLSARQGVADRFVGADAAVSYVEDRLSTTTIGSSDGVDVLVWKPSPAVKTVTLP